MTASPASDPATDPTDGQIWDVAVVGAGPAGSTAARTAAQAGQRVLLLEKAPTLPRYKTCGGGIVGTSMRALPAGFALPVKDQVHSVEFTLGGRLGRVQRTRAPLFSLVNRTDFDFALTQAAVAAGAVLRTGATVSRLDEEPDLVRLTLAGGEQVSARAVVGADGSASRVGGYVGVQLDQVDLGLEAEIPVPASLAWRWRGRVLLDWGPMPGSYGWVFPKGDTLTVGVICAKGQGEPTRQYLRDFIARLGLAGFEASISSGHLTRCRREDSPLARGRVLVAGDAAGLLEPWTREGISFALRSGRLAGQFAARLAVQVGTGGTGASAGYESAVRATLGEEMRTGRRLLAAFEKRPAVFHAAITLLPPAWTQFIKAVRGETNFAKLFRRSIPRRALDLLNR
jgi:geranylgeranyl reductase family protein